MKWVPISQKEPYFSLLLAEGTCSYSLACICRPFGISKSSPRWPSGSYSACSQGPGTYFNTPTTSIWIFSPPFKLPGLLQVTDFPPCSYCFLIACMLFFTPSPQPPPLLSFFSAGSPAHIWSASFALDYSRIFWMFSLWSTIKTSPLLWSSHI